MRREINLPRLAMAAATLMLVLGLSTFFVSDTTQASHNLVKRGVSEYGLNNSTRAKLIDSTEAAKLSGLEVWISLAVCINTLISLMKLFINFI